MRHLSSSMFSYKINSISFTAFDNRNDSLTLGSIQGKASFDDSSSIFVQTLSLILFSGFF